MAKPRRRFVDTDIGQIHMRITAPDAPKYLPLICLHQSPKSSREFERFMTSVSTERIVIAVDSPGHGESDLPPETPPVCIQDYARIIWQAVDQLSLKVAQFDLFGNHTGAKVAVEMAHQQQSRVRKIVMISALVLSPEEQKTFADQFSPIALDDAGSRFTHIWEQIRKYGGDVMTLEQRALSFAENIRAGEAYEWGHRAAFAYNAYFPDIIASLPHEITVLNPQDMLYEWTPRVEPLLKNGRVLDCPDWGHDALNVNTKDVIKVVEEVLKA